MHMEWPRRRPQRNETQSADMQQRNCVPSGGKKGGLWLIGHRRGGRRGGQCEAHAGRWCRGGR